MIKKYSFEEFKLMYESTEKVTDRRINNNKENYAIGVAILIAISVVWKWSIDNNKYSFCGLLFIFLLSGMATLFCPLWIGQIKDFKKLNDAKFDVINEMTENLYFERINEQIEIVSYAPFAKEWEKLKKINALHEDTRSKLITLKSSNAEFFIPFAFRIIFIFATFTSLLAIVVNPSQTWAGIQMLLHLK